MARIKMSILIKIVPFIYLRKFDIALLWINWGSVITIRQYVKCARKKYYIHRPIYVKNKQIGVTHGTDLFGKREREREELFLCQDVLYDIILYFEQIALKVPPSAV